MTEDDGEEPNSQNEDLLPVRANGDLVSGGEVDVLDGDAEERTKTRELDRKRKTRKRTNPLVGTPVGPPFR